MRDIVITLFVLGTLPFILKRAWLGMLMWVWVGVMNPHRLSWGFAYNWPFAQIVAIATFLALIFAQRRWRFPWTAPTIFLLLFVLWMSVSTTFALLPENVFEAWGKVMKIMLMIFVALI